MGLLFYQAYAIVHLKVIKNKYMSPEHNTPQEPAPTEKMITVPDWDKESIKENEVSFLSDASEIIANAEGTDPLEVRTSIESLLSNVNASVQRGEIVGSQGVYDTEMVVKQLKAFVEVANKPGSGESPYMRITKSGDLRQAFVDLGTNEATGARLVDAVMLYVEAYERKQKQRTDIADTALEATGVAQPESEDVSPFSNLDLESQQDVLNIRTAQANYDQSVREKDFSQAARDKEELFALKRDASAGAKKFLGL